MSRVIHFEIPAANPEKMIAFYTRVFGWKIDKWNGPVNYWLITTGDDAEPGINGAIAEKSETVQATTNTINVASFEEAIQKVTEAGGQVLMPKMAVPGVGYMTYCKDPEGNVFGVMQSYPQAK
ncbi:MAG: VOC family protein [Candidatus Bathyarchaeia archaeon]